jgi:phenylacetate-CoA ligase
MKRWTPLRLAWDAWWATRQGPGAIAARQRARLAHLVAFARARSPYYAARYRPLPSPVTDVRQLPPVTKAELMAHFDEWVTDPQVTRAGVEAFVADRSRLGQRYLGRYLVWTTSGTTGTPAILVHDRAALAVYIALGYARALLPWLTPCRLWRVLQGGGRGAGLLATGGHYAGVVLAEQVRRQAPWRARRLRLFSVLAPLPELVRALNAFQPVLLGGYPTVFALLAQEQAAGRLRLAPALIATAGESLPPAMRRQIEAAFRCPVRDSYGASEAVVLALDCGRGWLHVNADWVILEPVDAAYRPVPPGERSYTVLVTNLANRVQPIIRYDLGDRVVVRPDPCPCGSPLPAIRVEGRTDEILAFPAASGEAIHIAPLALATVVEETPGVRRFQVIQSAPTRLRLRLEAASPDVAEAVWEAVERRLRAYLTAQGVPAVVIERAPEPPAPDPRSGKFRQVWAAPPDPAAPPTAPAG